MADLSITASSVLKGSNASLSSGTAGVTITAGQAIYLDSATSTYKLADANLSASAAAVVGIALCDAASGQPFFFVTEDDDFTPGATLSMSAPVYVLSTNAGAIAPTADIAAGLYPNVLFIAKSTTKAVLKIVNQVGAVTT